MPTLNVFTGKQYLNDVTFPETTPTFATQIQDAMTENSVTYRSMLFNEMTRDRTLEEQASLQKFYADSWRAEAAEDMTAWGRFWSGWKADNIQAEITATADNLRQARLIKDTEQEEELKTKLAKLQFQLDQMPQPSERGWDSAYNLGQGLSTIADAFSLEAAWWAGETAVATAVGAVAGGPVGAGVAGTLTGLARGAQRLRRVGKTASTLAKTYSLWEMMRRRESGSLYNEIRDRDDLTEDQKQAMALAYGRSAATVELAGWTLGAGGLLVKGGKAVGSAALNRIPAIERWAQTQALKQGLKETAGATVKTTAQRLAEAGKISSRVVAGAASETAEEFVQQTMERSTIEQGLAGGTPTIGSVVTGGFQKMAGVASELVQGKLSEESISILEAMASALLPSLVVGGAGASLSAAFSGSEIVPANTGVPSEYDMKNSGLPQVIANAEKNLKRANALVNYLTETKNTEYIKQMVSNSEIEGHVFAAPEDIEMIMALGEMSPTAQTLIESTGIASAIREGRKTGTVEIPMQSFAEFVANEEIKESGILPEVSRRITFNSSEQSYESVDRKIRSSFNKDMAKKVKDKATEKLNQMFAGLRRQMEVAKYTPEEVEANIDIYAAALGTLEEASNGAVTAEELARDFVFNIERRDYDINVGKGLRGKKKESEAVEKALSKILGDKRRKLGHFTRYVEKGRKGKGMSVADVMDSVTVTAYAGSPLDYLVPSLQAIGTGEGHFAHGWGLYYALRFDTAESYRRRYVTNSTEIKAFINDEEIKPWYGSSSSPISLPYVVAAVMNTAPVFNDVRKKAESLERQAEEAAMILQRNQIAIKARAMGFDLFSKTDSEIEKEFGWLTSAASIKKSAIANMQLSDKEISDLMEKNEKDTQRIKDEISSLSKFKVTKSINEELKKYGLKLIDDRISFLKDEIKKYEKEIVSLESKIEAEKKYVETRKAAFDEDVKETMGFFKYIQDESQRKERAEAAAKSIIESVEKNVLNMQTNIMSFKSIIETYKSNIEKYKQIKKEMPEAWKNVKFKVKSYVTTGQTKQFTIRKIDTFMRENKPLYLQNGNIKKSIDDLLDKEGLSEIKDTLISGSNYTTINRSWVANHKDDVLGMTIRLYDSIENILSHEYSPIFKDYVEDIVSSAKALYMHEVSLDELKENYMKKELEHANNELASYKDAAPDYYMKQYVEVRLKKYNAIKEVADKVFEFTDNLKRPKLKTAASETTYSAESLYDFMVNHFLGKKPDDYGGRYSKKAVHEAKKKSSLLLAKYGINGMTYFGNVDKECLVVFNPSIIRAKKSYYSEQDGTTQDTEWFDLFDEDAGMRGKKEIYVAKHADTTTFAHEVMHFVVTSLVEMYNDGSITPMWRKEMDKLYEHFRMVPAVGTSRMAMSKDRKGKLTLEKEAHETLSAGFQRYIEEGKAHTESLEKLYAYIKDLSAKLWQALSRGYFRDRELSDPQVDFYNKVMQGHLDIVNTEYKYGYAPLEKMANVTDEEYELYKLERTVARSKSSNNMFKAQREMVKNREKARWKEIYDEAFQNAYKALADEPEYILIDYIVSNGGINRDLMYKSTKLAHSIPSKYYSKEASAGLTPQALVGKFGPEMNLVDIAKTLIATPDRDIAARREARNEADTKYLEETDPVSDIAPANAMRNILFIRSLVKESLMLKGDGLSKFNGHYKEWIKAAEEYVMGLTLKNASNLPKWADMESRITDDYITALNGGNTQVAALKADQRAMVNYVLVRSKQIQSQHAKFKRRFEKFFRMPTSQDLKNIDGITWNLIHTILQEYGYTTRRGRINANAYKQMQDWIAERKGNKFFPAQDFEAELEVLINPPKITSLSVEGFNRMAALVEKIRAVGENETKVFMEERQQRLDVVVGEIIENAEKMRKARGDKAFDIYRAGSLQSYITPQLGLLEPLFGELGMRELWVQLRDALVARDTLGDTVRSMIADSFIKNKITELLADRRKFDVGGWEVDNSVLLFALQHSGNQHNKQNAIATLQQYYKNSSFSETDYEELLNATPQEMRNYVNDLWAMFGFLKKQIDAQTRAATGGIVGNVDAEPYTMRDGTKMAGGYFPAPKVSIRNSTVDSVEAMYDQNLFFPMTGFTKDRINNKLGDLDMGQEQLARHIYKAVNFATTQVAFNDIQTVLNTKELKDFLGADYSKISSYISDWVRASIMPVTPTPKTIKAFQKLPTIAFLGFKAVSGLVQLLGVVPAYSQISAAELTKSAAKVLNIGKYFKMGEEMSKRSPFMADRSKKFDSRFYGLFNDKTFLEKQTRKYGEGIVSVALTFVRTFQNMADIIVWDAAHAEALNKGLSVDDARKHADYMVQKTQGDRTRMNTPKGFDSVAAKFFQPFMSYVLTLRQMYKGAALARKYKALGALVALVALSAYFEAYFKENDKDWRRKLLGKKTKGNDKNFWQRVQNRWIAQTVGTFGGVAMPFAGLGEATAFGATTELMKNISDGYRAYTSGGTPAVELWEKAVKAITLDENTLKDIYDWDMSLGANIIDFML